jgi:hypothetical protein
LDCRSRSSRRSPMTRRLVTSSATATPFTVASFGNE